MTTSLPLPAGARRLMAARAARSLGQGALVVDFTLYLHALHWSALAIGGLLSGSLLVGALATLLVGPASDRWGARPFLLGYEGVQLVAAAIAASTANPPLLALAAILGAFGRGANGGAGPFAPAEQSWMSRLVPSEIWGRTFHLNTATGLFGMGLGALLAALPAWWAPQIPLLTGYRLLFILVLLGSFTCLLLLEHTAEPRPTPAAPLLVPTASDIPPDEGDAAAAAGAPWRTLLTYAGINSLNGFGIGMIGPLIAYWMHLRFGVGPAAIGPGMALAFFAAGGMSLFGIRLIQRFGLVGTVLRLRILGIVMLALIPLAPSFVWAMAFYVVRSAMNQGSIGSRQALFLGLVHHRHRGLAATVNSLSIQSPRAVGPAIAAAFFAAGNLVLPFYLGAALQAAYLLLFTRFFRKHGRQE